MRKRLLNILVCPNKKKGSLILFAHKLIRNKTIISNLSEPEIHDSDDVINGVLLNLEDKCAYPIFQSVAILLSDTDVNTRLTIKLLQSIKKNCPSEFIKSIDSTIDRLKFQKNTSHGIWNREEMSFFDREVNSKSQRQQFLRKIKEVPLWELLITRSQLFDNIVLNNDNESILEVGCGNSRTISWLFHPKEYHYQYVGTDISLKRLLLAKEVIPDGDFIQCSVLNLPFKNDTFASVIGFGVFHHVSNPLDAIKSCIDKIKSHGYLALHEPIEKPKIISNNSILKRHLIHNTKDIHDNKIDGTKTIETVEKLKFNIILTRYENTIFRSPALRLLHRMPQLATKKEIMNTVLLLDKFALCCLKKLSKRFGPTALLMLAQKP